MKRLLINNKAKKDLFVKSGNRCAFPDCQQELLVNGNTFLGEIVHIESYSPAGPRYNPTNSVNEIFNISNLILLCPNHHRIIDASPEIYTIEKLKRFKEGNESIFENKPRKFELKKAEINFELNHQELLDLWQENELNDDEEFWQKLFCSNPAILSHILINPIIKVDDKSYLGGKSFDNKGGNIIDFLFKQKQNSDAILIEIKTPKTRLLGQKYRGNSYSISSDISGSIVQLLNYKNEFQRNYYALTDGSENGLKSFHPKCLLIAGSREMEEMDDNQNRSFGIFRNSLKDVEIITYDELYEKIKDVYDIFKKNDNNV
ncbi:DUF4263 domain-containing protein [Fulvivirga sp. 29W222]|uniref:DUF4263 domain-containing protein n=1 Tax=Fulvivirga marina TaxID=2494733 RepID=A0A937KCY7_9BACT|nr:Shedu anti-phage system protein SduA domain-containing protein [Fulvivirga marina]MBL6445683.1 DUF4263 domain-containing protein [Fulvivirga marina]